jgi:hypothetical protein
MTPKTWSLALALCLVSLVQASTAAGQQPPKNPDAKKFLEELNLDIWAPFTQAYATGNPDQYLGLHSKDFIRGQGDSKRIMNLAQYSEGVRRSFQRWKADGLKVDLQFRFLERIADDQLASERGIYQLSLTDPKGEVRRFYGKFHVFSRKENGVRKILVDYDSSEGETIGEKDYQAGFALDSFDR